MSVETQILHPLTIKILDRITEGKPFNDRETEVTQDGLLVARIIIGPDSILISDVRNTHIHFQLSAYRYTDLFRFTSISPSQMPSNQLSPTDTIVIASYKTREGLVHNPYMFASKFFQSGLSYLRRSSPTPVVGFLARWTGEEGMETNYVQFWDKVKELREMRWKDEKQIYRKSAFATWTGKQVAYAGYRNVSVKTQPFFSKTMVYALFTCT